MELSTTRKVEIVRHRDGSAGASTDWLAVEEPLEISIQTAGNLPQKVSITMRTPGNDEELAAGFLFTEGIVSSKDEFGSIEHIRGIPGQEENHISVTLNPGCSVDTASLNRNFYTTSSCGVCGKASIDAIRTVRKIEVESKPIELNSEVIGRLPEILRLEQETFEKTGGLHACALFNPDGKLLALREDVGRHNALDKLIGHFMLKDMLPLNNHVLLLSGRASFELIQKAAMAGIRIVLAIGAPSSLAVETANEFGICLVGFVRNHGYNMYCCPKEILITH